MDSLTKYKCIFEKQYKEPKEKYVVVSFSIFYIPEYIRHSRDKTYNNSVMRQLQFLYNLTLNINYLNLGFLPKNWYFRIYYDDSLFKFNHKGKYPWKQFISMYKNHKRIQFVKYKCPAFFKDNGHLNLFGTLLRLHPIFSPEENTSMVIMFDADNVFTKSYLDELEKFERSHFDYNAFSSKYETSYYMYDFKDANNDYYLRMGMVASKKKFDTKYWDFILHQLVEYKNKNFENMITFLYNLHQKIRPGKEIKSYKNFEYGMDEIILNYYVDKIFQKSSSKINIVRFSPMPLMVFNTLESYLRFYYKTNEALINNITNLIMSKISKNFKKDNFDKNMNIINKNLFHLVIRPNYSYKELDRNFIEPVRKYLPELKKLNIPGNIIKFFEQVSEKDFKLPHFDNYFKSVNIPNYLCE